MSLDITKSLGCSLAVAATMLLAHVGSAAAATPQGEAQQQVIDFLTGNLATHHQIPRTEGPRDVASRLDAQEFARRLLLGWSACGIGDSKSPKQHLNPAVSDDSGQSSAEDGDVQAAMRQVLLGKHS